MKNKISKSVPVIQNPYTKNPYKIIWRTGQFRGFSPFCSIEERDKLYCWNNQDSFSWKEEQTYWSKRLDEILNECKLDNWEDGAEKISLETILNAKTLLKSFISHSVLIKNVAPAYNGSVGFNWRNKKYSIMVSVGESGFVYYTRLNRETKEPSFLSVKLYEFEKLIPNLIEKFLYDSRRSSYSSAC